MIEQTRLHATAWSLFSAQSAKGCRYDHSLIKAGLVYLSHARTLDRKLAAT